MRRRGVVRYIQKGGWSGGSSRITATRPESLRSSVWLSSFIPRRDLVLPDGEPAPAPGFRVRRDRAEAEPPDPTTLHNALTHTYLRHARILSPVIPTVVSHAIVPLPSFYHRPYVLRAVIRLVDERGLLRPKPPPADPAPEPGREFFDLQFGFHSSPLRAAPLPEPRAAPLRLVIIFLSWLIPAQSPFRSSSAPLADDTSRHGCLSPATQVFHVVTYAHLRISSCGDRIASSGACSSHAYMRRPDTPAPRHSISQVAGR